MNDIRMIEVLISSNKYNLDEFIKSFEMYKQIKRLKIWDM